MPLENTARTGKSAQNITTSRSVCTRKQHGSTAAGLQSTTIGARGPILVGEGILLRITSILIPGTNYPLVFGVWLSVQFPVNVQSQFML